MNWNFEIDWVMSASNKQTLFSLFNHFGAVSSGDYYSFDGRIFEIDDNYKDICDAYIVLLGLKCENSFSIGFDRTVRTIVEFAIYDQKFIQTKHQQWRESTRIDLTPRHMNPLEFIVLLDVRCKNSYSIGVDRNPKLIIHRPLVNQLRICWITFW